MYINKLWINAINKLKTDKSKFSIDDMDKIVEFMSNYEKEIQEGIEAQIARDIIVYRKYDAIAMWVGDGGLIEHEPAFIRELVGLFGIE